MSAPVAAPLALGERFRPNPLLAKGEGDPVVFLHGAFGPEWSEPLDRLAERRRVLAPANVGATDLNELVHMDGILDLVLYYDELFDRLGLDRFDLIGHSFGGMVAAEYAAICGRRVRKLVLIDPLGLWRDDEPVADYNYVPRENVPALLYNDLGSERVQAILRAQTEGEQHEIVSRALDRMAALGSTNHFLWPIPERGLHKRLERIKVPTLLLWGAQDRIVPPSYAQDFAARIPDARVTMIEGAGHTPQVDQPEAVAAAIDGFLG